MKEIELMTLGTESGSKSTRSSRYGITIPFDGISLHQHRQWLEKLVSLGYSDVWSMETDGADGFTPLALAAAWTSDLQLGAAIIPAYTRGPALLAQSIASLAEAAPHRFSFGLGTSSEVIVAEWNGLEFSEPFKRVRDTVSFLRSALAGEKIDHGYETFEVRGFRLARPVEDPPPIFLAALRPGMLRLAGTEADGAVINWLSADDVAKVAPYVAGKDLVARIFVCPSEDEVAVRAMGRRLIATYLNVRAYADFHRWLGRGDQLQPMWTAWQNGDRNAAVRAISDETVDSLIIHGSPARCRIEIQRYVDNGVTIPIIGLLQSGSGLAHDVAHIAPNVDAS
jgi:probable F420-dependent oxidoreductase